MAWAGPVTPLRAGASLPGRSGASLTSQTDVVCGVSQATRLPAVRGLPSLTLLLAVAARTCGELRDCDTLFPWVTLLERHH